MVKRFLIIVILISVGSLCYSRHKFPDHRKKIIKKYPVQSNWKKIEYKGVLTLDDSKDEALYKYLSDIASYKNFLFLVDNNGHSVKVFDFKGKFIRSIGRRGKGPGDLYWPFGIATFEDKIYIRSQNGLDIFDLKGKFKDRIKNFAGSSPLKIIKDGFYVSASGRGYERKPTIALKLDKEGKVVKVIRSQKLSAPIYRMSSRVFIDQISKHKFVFVMQDWNKIFFYNEKDNVLEEKEIPYKFGTELDQMRLDEGFDPKSMIHHYNNYISGAKVYDNKIFILLNIRSRVEMLTLNFKGEIIDHYYNDKELAMIDTDDFIIRKEKGVTTLYIFGFSIDKESDDYEESMIYKATIKD